MPLKIFQNFSFLFSNADSSWMVHKKEQQKSVCFSEIPKTLSWGVRGAVEAECEWLSFNFKLKYKKKSEDNNKS